ncbi:MAG: general secretion pathway protein GspB [Polaromonas sp.]
MSYILEALKKSEHARLASQLPALQSLVMSAETPVRERPAWLFGATLVAVLAGAAGLGWWLSGKPHEKPVPEQVASAPAPPAGGAAQESGVNPRNSYQRAVEPPRVASGPDSAKAVPKAVFSAAPSPAALRGMADAPVKDAVRAKPAVIKAAASQEALASAAVDKKPAAHHAEILVTNASVEAPRGKTAPGSHVVRIDELPPEVRREIPKISATGYVYSADAGVRVVSINERSLQEGEELMAGMKLEKIAPDHVLFSFRGYRFRVEMF